MKLSLIFLYFIPILIICQENQFNIDQKAHGLLTTSHGIYLVIDKGFIPIKETDLYTEYYRKIHNDSTLINPNTVLNSEFDLNIIPYILPNVNNQQIGFNEPLNIGMFLKLNDSGNFNLTSYANKMIDSLITK